MSHITYEVRVYDYGSKHWFLNGKRHREDGPALEHPNGSKSWFLNGRLHREDGPAIERASGSNEWYLNGVNYSELDFNAKMNPETVPQSCNGKVVEIDGVQYELKEVK